MSSTWVVVPTCLPIVLRRCRGCPFGHFRAHGTFRVNAHHKLLGPGVAGRSDRPAWQSPYGPPSHRAHRGRWAPVPGVANPRSSLPREYLCGRCD